MRVLRSCNWGSDLRDAVQNAGVPEHFILDEALCDVSGDIFEHWISDMELQRSRFMDPQAPPAEAAPLPNTRDNMAAMPATPAEFLRMVQSDALIR